MLTDRAKLSKALAELHCTLWPGIAFDLTDPRERDWAVSWLIGVICWIDGLE